MSSLFSVEGKHALVTGGTRGIGRAICDLFLAQGAILQVVARTAEELGTRVDAWRANGGTVEGIVADVSTAEGRWQVLHQVRARYEHLDLFVNCAGTNIRRRSVDYSIDEYRRVLDTNATAAFELSRHLHPLLRVAGDDDRGRRGRSTSVVFIGSTAGLSTVPTGAPYAMSKAALDQLTRYLAVEWAPDGIRVNSVAPWYIRTPLVEDILADEEYYQRVLGRTPLGRIGEPTEVAAAVLFLCGAGASFITGQTIAVDGGFLAKGM
ncbi:MAG: SDR family oxidoreductase [Bacteroidota bacterium]|nr:SDR family oxidoreductase [Bacteroidota bacterium]